MTLCIENLKDSIKKPLKLINKFGKVAGYKSVDNLLCFFTEITNYPKKEIMKTIPFATTSKRIKYLGINVTKEVKDLWIEITTY